MYVSMEDMISRDKLHLLSCAVTFVCLWSASTRSQASGQPNHLRGVFQIPQLLFLVISSLEREVNPKSCKRVRAP